MIRGRYARLIGLLLISQILTISTALAAAGTLDTSFDGDGKVTTNFGPARDDARGIVIQPNAKVLAVGFTDVTPIVGGGFEDFALARYRPDGSLDPLFSDDGKVTTDFGGCEFASAVLMQPDGKFVVGGTFLPAEVDGTGCGPGGDFALARYLRSGALDSTFGTGGVVTTSVAHFDSLTALAIQPDGKIVAAGSSLLDPNAPGSDFALARYLPNGSLDTTFAGDGTVTTDFGGRDFASGVAIQPNGKIVLAGQTAPGTKSYFAVARYLQDGTLDISFSHDGKVATQFAGSSAASDVVVWNDGSPDGKIVAAGWANTGTVTGRDFALVRYRRFGTRDWTFGIEGKVTTHFGLSADEASAIAVQNDSLLVVTGWTHVNDVEFALARYIALDGSLDESFDGDGRAVTDFGGFDFPEDVAIDPFGRIVVGGRSGPPFNVGPDDRVFAIARYTGS